MCVTNLIELPCLISVGVIDPNRSTEWPKVTIDINFPRAENLNLLFLINHFPALMIITTAPMISKCISTANHEDCITVLIISFKFRGKSVSIKISSD